MADTILCIGNSNAKLPLLLNKLGYSMLTLEDGRTLSSFSQTDVVDLVIYESGDETSFEDVLNLLRSQPATRHSGVVYISENAEDREAAARFQGVELLEAHHSLGVLASRIATLLRLRKMKGLDETSSSLSEVNAALRDLNSHYQKELEEARQIQASLLPQDLPEDSRYDVAVFYSPLEEVGGDWYNIRIERSDKVSAQVADVSGHGLAAAFLGSMAKLGFSAVAREMPHELLEGINVLLTPQMPPGRFVTMCGFLFDPRTGHLDFARAGHQPAVVFRASSGGIDELKGEGFAMGFFDVAQYSHEETDLDPGDSVLIFSDGLVEAQNRAAETFGIEGIARSLRSLKAAANSGEIVKKVIADFEAFMDGRVLKDDVTLLVLRRGGA